MTNNQIFPRINTPKVSEMVYSILREKIISKEFAEGERLELDDICKHLGVSKTPIKEALSHLESEGLVRILPRSGTFVSNFSKTDIEDSFDVRRVLECFAVEIICNHASDQEIEMLDKMVENLGKLAKHPDIKEIYPDYLRLDHEFHRQVVLQTKNKRLQEAHERENLHAQMARIRYRSFERELDKAQNEHERMIMAIKERNVEKAVFEINSHLQRAKQSLLNDMNTVSPLKEEPRQ
jgi:DNA-binding GntR family transcriptional regulator